MNRTSTDKAPKWSKEVATHKKCWFWHGIRKYKLFIELPTHTQAVERAVMEVTLTSKLVCDHGKREDVIKTRLSDRSVRPQFESKKQFNIVEDDHWSYSLCFHGWVVGEARVGHETQPPPRGESWVVQYKWMNTWIV